MAGSQDDDPQFLDPPPLEEVVGAHGDTSENGTLTAGIVEDATGEGITDMKDEEPSDREKRAIKKTERAKSYHHLREKQECERLLKRLTRQEKLLTLLMESEDNKEKVVHDSNEYDKTFSDLIGAYTRFIELIEVEEEEETARKSLNELDASVFDFKEKIYTWMTNIKEPSVRSIRSSERHSQKSISVKTSRSVRKLRSNASSSHASSRQSSSGSSVSSRSSVASNSSRKSYLDHKAEAAGLRAEASILKRKREAELEAELLEFDQKIQRAEAMEQVYADELDLDSFRYTEEECENKDEVGRERQREKRPKVVSPGKEKAHRHGKQRLKVVSPRREKAHGKHRKDRKKGGIKRETEEVREPKQKDKEEKTVTRSSQSFDKSLLQVLQLQSAPKVDIDVFTGNILEYQYFVETFKEVVERVIPDERGRLTRLIQSTSGEAKELIRHCVHLDRDTCYSHAMSLMNQQYGDPHRIASAYLKELRQWPKLNPHDSSAFRSFDRFLIKCEIYKKRDYLKELDSAEILRCLVLKLPVNLQDKWNRKVDTIRTKESKVADFQDFCSFISVESRIANDPLYSREALQAAQECPEPPLDVTTLSTNLQPAGPKPNSCQMCAKEHDLDDCENFKGMSRSARMSFLYKQKLCYGCYGTIGNNHKAETCTQKRVCGICKENHPTGLHKHEPPPTPLSETVVTSRPTAIPSSGSSETVSMCVIPVLLSHKDHPEKELLVYAVLDDCSKGTFILEDTLVTLNIEPKNSLPVRLTIKTMNGAETEDSLKVKGLTVRCSPNHLDNYPSSRIITLPDSYARPMIPIEQEEIPTPEKVKHWKHLESLLQKLPSYDPSIPFGLLIGANCPKALEPHEVIPSAEEGPYAFRSQLGWCVVGPLGLPGQTPINNVCSRATTIDAATNKVSGHYFSIQKEVEDTSIKEMLVKMYEAEFADPQSEKRSLSEEDRKFMSTMETNCQFVDGHYQLPLPFRKKEVKFPNNKKMAIQRIQPLKRRFEKSPKFRDDYVNFMNLLIENGYARKCDLPSTYYNNWNGWFIPHHGVYHPQKPDKFRIVFDCSARFKDVALNTELLQGPDLTNLQIGVFLRFRKEEVPFMADIECMFYQVLIPPEQRTFVRYLWWPDGDLSSELCEFEMCVHLFGAISSPGVANFALRKCATDYRVRFGEEAYRTVLHHFYVDDLLKSMSTETRAINLAKSVQGMCKAGGFNLTKFISPSTKLIKNMQPEKRVKFVDDLNIPSVPVTIERALGYTYCVEIDALKLRITLHDTPLTKRGMLSSIQTIYDQDGAAGPFVLEGKMVLQEVTSMKGDWDDDAPQSHTKRWEKWRNELILLQSVEIPRCFKPPGFGSAVDASLHTFSDASERGYGKCSYLRQINSTGNIHVSLVFSKSRVAPLKTITIPRLELTAATLAANTHAMLKEELMMDNLRSKFWVDSKIVLGYILNDERRYKTFVANRKQKINSSTQKEHWDYVDTKSNPADYCSRGISPKDTIKMKKFFQGPPQLWEKEEDWKTEEVITECHSDDEEVKTEKVVKVNHTDIQLPSIVEILEQRISRYSRWKRAMGWIKRFINNCRSTASNRTTGSLSTDEICNAETTILGLVQTQYFPSDKVALKSDSKRVTKHSHIRKLNPFLDEKGVMRVGGRLRKGDIATDNKFPIIVPKESIAARRILEWCHMMVEHSGRTTSLNEARSRGYWVINSSSIVRSIVHKCVHCRSLRGKFGQQKMADLPKDRIEPEAPFTSCGVDMFGPFYVKEGRKEMKRYVALFTCFSSRAIHMEVANSMSTDSFIMTLRRLIARRGAIRSIRSDNGGNFVGADNEFKKAYKEMDQEKIAEFLSENGCDWIQWERNPPTASHMGGVWERMIRSVREILQSLLKNHAHSLNDESLHTLLLEAEAIVNSRPLTLENINDPDSLPLSPTQLLTMKSKIVLPPPGIFQKEDVYARKRWRRVQHLSNEFWQRWRKEYLNSLQERQKWNSVRRNFQVDDIVLLRDDALIRNHWPRGRIIETFPDSDNLVRTVKLRIANSKTPVIRPISKVVLLLECGSGLN